MNTRSTLILLVVALLLGGYFLVFETDYFGLQHQSNPSDKPAIPVDGVALFDSALMSDQVTQLTIALPDEPPVVIERDGDRWRQTAPVRFAMENWAVEEVARRIANLRYTNRIDPAESTLTAASAGLDPAQATVTIRGKTDDKPFEHVLKLGRIVAAGRAYLMLKGEPHLLVTSDALHEKLLDKPVTELRAKSLTVPTANRLQSVTLVRGEQTIALEQTDAKWAVVKPYMASADRNAVEHLIDMPRLASIDAFIADQPDDLSRYGLDTPSRRLTLTARPADESSEAVTQHLTIGSAADLSDERFFAMLDDVPVVFTLRKTDVAKLDVEPLDLRSRKLIDINRDAIQSIALRSSGTDVTLLREGGTWAFDDPKPDYPPDEQMVAGLLDCLLNTESTDAEILPADAPDKAPRSVVITLNGSEQTTLMIERGDNTSRVVVAGQTLAQIVDTAGIEPLFGDAAYFRNRTVWDLKPEQVKSIAIQRTGEYPAEFRFERTNEQWQLDGYDQQKFNQLLGLLAPLRAEKWQPVALAQSDFPLTVTLTDEGNQTHRLSIASVPMRIGLATGADSQFVLPKPLVDLLTGELRQTTVIDLEIDAIASVTGGDWTIERDENAMYTFAGERELDEAKCGALFDTLAGLQCEHWLQAKPRDTEPTHVLKIKQRKAGEHLLELWIPTDWSKQKAFGVYDGGKPFVVHRDAAEKLGARPVREPEK